MFELLENILPGESASVCSCDFRGESEARSCTEFCKFSLDLLFEIRSICSAAICSMLSEQGSETSRPWPSSRIDQGSLSKYCLVSQEAVLVRANNRSTAEATV